MTARQSNKPKLEPRVLVDVDEFFDACHARHDAKGKPSRPTWRPVPKSARDYAAEESRGEHLRATGRALPVCWIPGEPIVNRLRI